MKKILIVIVILILLYYIPTYFPIAIGPFGYNYSICENGFYGKYPKNTPDSGVAYYDSSGNKVYQVNGFPRIGPNPDDEKFFKTTGQCTEVNFWKFFLTKKLGL